MDFAVVLKAVVNFFLQLCSVKCVFAGIEFSVGSVFIWSALAALVIMFLRGMAK